MQLKIFSLLSQKKKDIKISFNKNEIRKNQVSFRKKSPCLIIFSYNNT